MGCHNSTCGLSHNTMTRHLDAKQMAGWTEKETRKACLYDVRVTVSVWHSGIVGTRQPPQSTHPLHHHNLARRKKENQELNIFTPSR